MIRVIVADDEYKVCQLICQLINWDELGMELVGTASNGIEALEMIEREKPDLVLTDIRMPGYDGIEVLKRIRENNPNIEFIIISGYSHFEYAQSAIEYGVSNYILKPIDAEVLNATLQKVRKRYMERKSREKADLVQQEQQAANAARLRDMLLNDLVSGIVSGDMDAINKKYYYNFEDGLFQTFMIFADFKDIAYLNESYANNVISLLYSKAVIYFEKQVIPLCFEGGVFLKDNQVMGIINYSAERKDEVREALISFIHSLSVELGIFEHMDYHLSTSKALHTIEHLSDGLVQAERSMGQRLLHKDRIFLDEAVEDKDFNREELFKPFSVALSQSLDILNRDQLTEAVSSLKAAVLAHELNGCQIIQLVKDAYRIFLLSSLFQNLYDFPDRIEREQSFNKKVMYCNTVEKLFSFLNQNCQEDLKEALAWRDKERMRPIMEAKQYIREHFAEPIDLEEVSSHIGFSYSYFSTLFKKETGKTFLTYLTDIRIDEAKKLLRESNLNIEEISRAVGFNDYKRFAKAFKKATFITPKEYRKLYS